MTGVILGRNYVEILFRQWKLLIIPVIACTLAAGLVGLTTPREYSATASLWVDTRAPADTTAGDPTLSSSPAGGQLTLLSQLLMTRSFMDLVGQTGPYAEEYNAAGPLDQLYMQFDIASHVSVSSPGPQLLSLTVTGTDPDEVVDLADTVLVLYQQEQSDIVATRAEAQVQYNLQMLESAQTALAEAQPGTDAYEVAADRVAEANERYTQGQQTLEALAGAQYRVVGAPDVVVPEARKKGVVMAVAGGMAAGLTISLILLIVLMLRDTTLRSEDEAAKLLPLSVAGSLPHVRLGNAS